MAPGRTHRDAPIDPRCIRSSPQHLQFDISGTIIGGCGKPHCQQPFFALPPLLTCLLPRSFPLFQESDTSSWIATL
jgi:hypothetical protein